MSPQDAVLLGYVVGSTVVLILWGSFSMVMWFHRNRNRRW